MVLGTDRVCIRPSTANANIRESCKRLLPKVGRTMVSYNLTMGDVSCRATFTSRITRTRLIRRLAQEFPDINAQVTSTLHTQGSKCCNPKEDLLRPRCHAIYVLPPLIGPPARIKSMLTLSFSSCLSIVTSTYPLTREKQTLETNVR
jgi:hypothetical protein